VSPLDHEVLGTWYPGFRTDANVSKMRLLLGQGVTEVSRQSVTNVSGSYPEQLLERWYRSKKSSDYFCERWYRSEKSSDYFCER
jgi:hypothetical protein